MGFTTPCFMKNYDEEWKDVVGYEGLYKVSNYGRVKSLGRYKKIISGKLNIWGYSQVGLTKYGTKKMFSIHRLVAQAFIPNPENKPCVDHIDTDRRNNSVNNLQWCTYSENACNPITRKRKSMSQLGKKHSIEARKKMSISRSKPVNQYDLSGKFIRTWDSIKDAAASYGKTPTLIRLSIREKHHIFANSQWRLFNDNTLDIQPYEERTFAKVKVVFSNEKETVFKSIQAASIGLNISRRQIYNYLQGKVRNKKIEIRYV